MRKYKLLSVVLITVIALSGCQNNPESSIVKNKDMEKLIEQAKETPSPNASGKPKEDLKEMEEKYDCYKTTFSDDKLKVNVDVDAKVDIPKTDKLSVLQVKQQNISQEFLDKVRETFLGDKALYNGVAATLPTKASLEEEISMLQQQLKDETHPDYSESMNEETQGMIDRAKEAYETAPVKIDVTQYKSDGKLSKITDEVVEEDFKNYYEWQYDVNPGGEVFYGVSDASDGWYESLYVQNSKNRSNCIRYAKAKDFYIHLLDVFIETDNLGAGNQSLCPVDQDINQYYVANWSPDEGEPRTLRCENETVTITEEEALAKANELLKGLGLDDFECEESGFFYEILVDGETVADRKCRKEYIFQFARTVNGVSVLTEGNKYVEEGNGESYTKKLWPKECIEVKVNDDGIVEFIYNAPLEVTETVVDQSNIKTFEEIKEVFEQMVTVANAREDYETKIIVNEVKLRYEKISEKDSFDTGLLIPAWDFIGRKITDFQTRDGSILTINAIDGSIINRELGY